MIKPATADVRLGIILTNTNKALAEALRHVSAEQLSQIRENKDVKSFLNSVFHDTITASKSDQTLLEILKNAPVFKNMGNFSDDLNTLLSKIKDSPALSSQADALETFVQNSSKTDGNTLKTQMVNSGIFMESKLAAAIRVPETLSQTLESLKTLFSQSSLSDTKPIQNAVASLLDGATINDSAHDPKSARQLADVLQKITDAYQQLVSKSDVLYAKPVSDVSLQLERLISAAPLSSQTVQEVKSALSQLYGILLGSSAKETSTLLDSIESLLKNLNTAKPAEESATALRAFSGELKSVLENPDSALRPETSALVAKLAQVSGPDDVLLERLLKDSLGNDLKSQLMKLSEEIQGAVDSSDTELLDPINKLLLQIDYHQLLSHLSASSSIYFPFAWDQLDEGSVSFKKSHGKKFYCEINLTLKEYGKLDLMLALSRENRLEIQARSEKNEFKELIHANLPLLRSILIDSGFSLQSIRIAGPDESIQSAAAAYETKNVDSDFGFEAKA